VRLSCEPSGGTFDLCSFSLFFSPFAISSFSIKTHNLSGLLSNHGSSFSSLAANVDPHSLGFFHSLIFFKGITTTPFHPRLCVGELLNPPLQRTPLSTHGFPPTYMGFVFLDGIRYATDFPSLFIFFLSSKLPQNQFWSPCNVFVEFFEKCIYLIAPPTS